MKASILKLYGLTLVEYWLRDFAHFLNRLELGLAFKGDIELIETTQQSVGM